MDLVVFPDAALVAVDYLRPELADRDLTEIVGHDVPDPRPEGSFVTVRRGGGVRRTVVSDAPVLLVECWAATSEAAHDLAQMARALLMAMAGTIQDGVVVYRVDELGGPADLPDPLSSQPRYVFTVQVHLRGLAQ